MLMQLAEIKTNPMMLVDCSEVTDEVIPDTETGTIISQSAVSLSNLP